MKIVKNTTLATVIARIMVKLLSAIKNSYQDRLVLAGRPIAEAVAMKAFSYGNKEALGWARDMNYIKYMGMTYASDQMVRSGNGIMVMKRVKNN